MGSLVMGTMRTYDGILDRVVAAEAKGSEDALKRKAACETAASPGVFAVSLTAVTKLAVPIVKTRVRVNMLESVVATAEVLEVTKRPQVSQPHIASPLFVPLSRW